MADKRVAYIAGPMTGIQGKNRAAFCEAQAELEKRGYLVLNPAMLPDGMDGEKYMPICLAMVQQADVVWLLPGWENSNGARIEQQMAEYQGIPQRFFIGRLTSAPADE